MSQNPITAIASSDRFQRLVKSQKAASRQTQSGNELPHSKTPNPTEENAMATATKSRSVFRRQPLAASGPNGKPDMPTGRRSPEGMPPAKTQDPKPKTDQHGDQRQSIERQIPLDSIEPSPWQRRRAESPEDLRGLADSLIAHGLGSAVQVRTLLMAERQGKYCYQLLAGHRRCQAARLAGWTTIRASVQECTDAEAREIVLLENLQRKDLSAIEEAECFRQILDAEGAPTQVELAARLGKSQGHIAQRLRYLRVPQQWQDLVISGAIPASHLRLVLPYCEHPKARAAIIPVAAECVPNEKEKKQIAAGQAVWDPPDAENLQWSLVRGVLKWAHDLDRGEYDRKGGHFLSTPKLSDEDRKKLDILTIEDGDGKTEYAFNKAYWFQLARAAAKDAHEKSAKPAKAKTAAGEKPKPLTPAQQKAEAARQAQQKKIRREQLGRRRKTIAVDFQRWLIAENVLRSASLEELLELAVRAALKGWAHHGMYGHIGRAMKKLEGEPVPKRAARMVAEIFWNSAEKCPSLAVSEYSGDVQRVMKFLKIDAAAAWQKGQMGPLSGAWWNAFDKEELADTAWHLNLLTQSECEKAKKGDLVKALLKCTRATVPAELGGEKSGKPAAGKKAAKQDAEPITEIPLDDEPDEWEEDENEEAFAGAAPRRAK